MRTSDGQKMQVPGHGCGRVSTATGVTPESVRTGRRRRRAASSDAEPGAPNARSPARISLFEKSEAPPFGWRLTMRSSARASSSASRAISSRMAESAARCACGSKGGRRDRVFTARLAGGYCTGTVDDATALALNELNLALYRDRADEWDAVRTRAWRGFA